MKPIQDDTTLTDEEREEIISQYAERNSVAPEAAKEDKK